MPARSGPSPQLKPVVAAADAAGLQMALHAIGDHASEIALDAIEHAIAAQRGPRAPAPHRAPRVRRAGTAERMARLGVTASMQPVHADPAIFDNWAAELGDERVDRAFPWPEYVDAGALLAFSTDAPTAPHEPWPTCTSRRHASRRWTARCPRHPQFALPLERRSVTRRGTPPPRSATATGAAASRRASPPTSSFSTSTPSPPVPQSLLEARVVRTIVAGETVYDAGAL